MRDTSSRDERMSKATEKKENLEADFANMKFDAGADEEPFMKVKGLVMGLISRLRDESSSQANQKAYCKEVMSKHAPVPQVMEELVEVSKVSLRTGFNSNSEEVSCRVVLVQPSVQRS